MSGVKDFYKKLFAFRRVGKQPLPVLAAGIILTGLIMSELSWGAAAKQPLVFNSGKNSAPNSVMGANTTNSTDQSQASTVTGSTSSGQPAQSTTQGTNNSQSNDYKPEPDKIIKPPVTIPIKPPCTYCTPLHGRACPMIIYPCNPCVTLPYPGSVCRLPVTE